MFIPCSGPVRPVGRVEELVVPAAELAVIVHDGPHDDVDRSYGALAAHVTEHELAVDGPIREYYLAYRHDTADEAAWRTEIGWPIFQTEREPGRPASSAPGLDDRLDRARRGGRPQRVLGLGQPEPAGDQPGQVDGAAGGQRRWPRARCWRTGTCR